MDEHQKQIVSYIREHLQLGHSEVAIRDHLRANGWSQNAVADAFTRYHQATTPKPRQPSKLRKLSAKLPKISPARLAKTTFALVIVVAVAQGVRVLVSGSTEPTAAPVAIHLTQQQRQGNDVNVIAGAIAYYTTSNGGTLPTKTLAEPDGSLELCNATCDPATSTVSTLSAYKASNVSIQAYQPALTAPDTNSIYLVPAAKCKDGKTIGEPSTARRSMIILYATTVDAALTQHCVTL